MNILLLGLRASGKSTVGPLLAARLGRPFVELDDLTAQRLNAATAGEALRSRGEPAFRKAEAEALRDVLSRDGQVIALGGGTPTAPGASELIKSAQRDGRARAIYLRASVESLRARLVADTADRPSLTGADPVVEVEVLFAKRDPAYLALADDAVNVDAMEAGEVVELIVVLLA